jgi:hypothetical protein
MTRVFIPEKRNFPVFSKCWENRGKTMIGIVGSRGIGKGTGIRGMMPTVIRRNLPQDRGIHRKNL